METQYGLPIVTSDTVFAELEQLGIQAWRQLRPPQDLVTYAESDLSDPQREELARFAPQAQAAFFEQPNGRLFTGFRSMGRDWGTVFALVPNQHEDGEELVPIIGEWKHGAEVLSLSPPAGVPNKKDQTHPCPMERCAKREFEEETGLALESLTPLSDHGIAVSSRQTNQLVFPFLGIIKEPIRPQPSSLDGTEHLACILVPLSEWWKLITQGLVLEASSHVVTLLALKQLGRLQLI